MLLAPLNRHHIYIGKDIIKDPVVNENKEYEKCHEQPGIERFIGVIGYENNGYLYDYCKDRPDIPKKNIPIDIGFSGLRIEHDEQKKACKKQTRILAYGIINNKRIRIHVIILS